mmetsp:Transcript_69635/g.157428  ORF Transcript_69635/g.157428 Transcript_69635/m.157428 type:complete len:230 (-) Transcript_69635:905-1594(-)
MLKGLESSRPILEVVHGLAQLHPNDTPERVERKPSPVAPAPSAAPCAAAASSAAAADGTGGLEACGAGAPAREAEVPRRRRRRAHPPARLPPRPLVLRHGHRHGAACHGGRPRRRWPRRQSLAAGGCLSLAVGGGTLLRLAATPPDLCDVGGRAGRGGGRPVPPSGRRPAALGFLGQARGKVAEGRALRVADGEEGRWAVVGASQRGSARHHGGGGGAARRQIGGAPGR